MSISVRFYTFSKKVNSTARPTASGEEHQCTLKTECDLLNPNIILQRAWAKAPAFNYAYISDFGRYYFVNDWAWSNGHWSASLKVDVLASWKNSIGNTTTYVSRAVSEYDNTIADSIYQTKGGSIVHQYPPVGYDDVASGSPYTEIFPNEGTYVLGIMNGDNRSGSVGGVSYYALPIETMLEIKSALYDINENTSWLGDTSGDMSIAMYKTIYNPFQYIESIRWYPFPISDIANMDTASKQLYCGCWLVPLTNNVYRVKSGAYFRTNRKFNVVKRFVGQPQYFLNRAPYTSYKLYFPPFGFLVLDNEQMLNCESIDAYVTIDVITGEGYLTIYPNYEGLPLLSDTPLGYYTAKIGVDLLYGEVSRENIFREANTAADMATSLGSGVFGALSTIGRGLISGLEKQYFERYKSTIGSGVASPSALWQYYPALVVETIDSVEIDPNLFGYPLNKIKKINTLSGFVLCASSDDFKAECTESEASEIRGHLTSGFFYE